MFVFKRRMHNASAVRLVPSLVLVAALLAAVPSATAERTPARLVPNAIAFRDAAHGIAGTGVPSLCSGPDLKCRGSGTISVTSDAGRTWHVVRRSPLAVVWVGFHSGAASARLDDDETLQSADGGRTWHRAIPPTPPHSPCPRALSYLSDVVGNWALCTGQGVAGLMGKAVYRLTVHGWKRVAWTPLPPPKHGYGGIALYGYPRGMAMADDGFGLIWESRGTLYVTRDGGSHWHGLPKVAQPEVDSGGSAAALRHGIGFVLLARSTATPAPHQVVRLLETRDAGRTWHLRHRWP